MRRVASRWVETGVPSTCVTMSPGISPIFSPTEPCRTICTRGRITLSLSEPLSIVMPCSGESAAQKRGRRRVEEATARTSLESRPCGFGTLIETCMVLVRDHEQG